MTYNKNPFWIAQQDWEDVFFFHIPVPYERLQGYIPEPFQLETYDNQAWLSFVLLQSKHSQLRGVPISYPSFFQLNLRTYVNCNGHSGVYFLSIDANHLPIVLGGRWLSIPQYFADIKVINFNNRVSFSSRRNKSKAELFVEFSPLENHLYTKHPSLNSWLTDRYLMWFIWGDKIIRGTVSHDPWILKEALLNSYEIKGFLPLLPEVDFKNPLIHYAKRKHAYVYPFKVEGIYHEPK